MKKFTILISIILILAFILNLNQVQAVGLVIEVKADKQTAQIGDNVVITVDWKSDMQAADYILKYDSAKLQFDKASIGADYLNTSTKGQIGVSWFSSDNKNLKQMTFTFKVLEKGDASVSVQIDGGFSDGNMKMPESYDVKTKGTLKLTLTEKTTQTPTPDTNKPNNTANGGNQNNQQNAGNNQNSNNENKPQTPNSSQSQQQEQNKNQPQTTQSSKNVTTASSTAGTANKNLPKTGDKTYLVIIGLMAFVVMIPILHKQYRKYRGI